MGSEIPSDRSAFSSVQQAFKVIWKREKIENLSRKLDRCRLELNSHVLILVNARCRGLEKSQAEIAEIVAFAKEQTTAANNAKLSLLRTHTIGGRNKDVFNQQSTCKDASSGLLENVSSILITYEDGTNEIISSNSESNNCDATKIWDEDIKTATIFRSIARPLVKQVVSVESYPPVARTILDWLYFPMINRRVDDILEAHKKTFDWIFTHNRFVDFVERGNGTFWITGKAGSGKSTLMKFLHEHHKTKQLLDRWAGLGDAMIVSFFFWNAGTSLQKSSEGLLRSILWEILQKYKCLIPIAFPHLCCTYLTTHEVDGKELRFSELKSGLRRLLLHFGSPGLKTKICLFIDGMDEYEGDHLRLCKFFGEMTGSHIKVILSSRPWNVFKVYFNASPSISMQELTRGDIELYVSDHLEHSQEIARLGISSQEQAKQVLYEIVNRAEGVFLWVVFVVRSLLNGLYNNDDLVDLQNRLDALPNDLNRLYHHMFQGLDPIYRRQAAKIFLLVLHSQIQYSSISLLQVAYACENDMKAALRLPPVALSPEERNSLSIDMEKKITSRCGGLLEVRNKPLSEHASPCQPYPHVRFLHKSVKEFLQSREIQANIMNDVSRDSFDAGSALLASSLYEVKVLPIDVDLVWISSSLRAPVLNCLWAAADCENTCAKPCVAVLDELDSTILARWKSVDRFKLFNEDTWMDPHTQKWPAIYSRATRFTHDLIPMAKLDHAGFSEFFIIAQRTGCLLYVAHKLAADRIKGRMLHLILHHTIVQFTYPIELYKNDGKSLAGQRLKAAIAGEQILQQVNDPNAVFAYESPLDCLVRMHGREHERSHIVIVNLSSWEYYLMVVWFVATVADQPEYFGAQLRQWRDVSMAIQYLRFFQQFLESGALLQPEFAGIHQNLEHTKPDCEEYERMVGLPPKSARNILQRLEQVVCDPAKRTFPVNIQSNELDLFRVEFIKTMDTLHKREIASKPKPQRQILWELYEALMHSPTIRSTLSFVAGGILVALIARLISRPI